MAKPVIDYSKCTKCGTCVDICPATVFKNSEKGIEVAQPGECIGCKSCEIQCPVAAIKVVEEEE